MGVKQQGQEQLWRRRGTLGVRGWRSIFATVPPLRGQRTQTVRRKMLAAPVGMTISDNSRRKKDNSIGAYRRWLTARMLPSVSLNQAVFAPPPVAMLLVIFMPGMLYSSKFTPRDFRSATSASTLVTLQ